MKVTLYMTLTATGQLTRAGADFEIPPEVFNDFGRLAREAGNLVIGRRTFEQMRQRNASSAPGVQLVVVSRSLHHVEGASVAASPREALALLEGKGFQNVILGGGSELYSAFLSEGLVDELCVNIAPMGITHNAAQTGARFLGSSNLTPEIIQLRYAMDRTTLR